jgi:hypothetical protein
MTPWGFHRSSSIRLGTSTTDAQGHGQLPDPLGSQEMWPVTLSTLAWEFTLFSPATANNKPYHYWRGKHSNHQNGEKLVFIIGFTTEVWNSRIYRDFSVINENAGENMYSVRGLSKIWHVPKGPSSFVGKMVINHSSSVVPHFRTDEFSTNQNWCRSGVTSPNQFGDGSKPYPPGEH